MIIDLNYYTFLTQRYLGPQQEGVARRKPGRGVPTRSMSCSDKLAKW